VIERSTPPRRTWVADHLPVQARIRVA